MAYHNPQHIARLAIEAGTKKVHLPFLSVLLLGFLGGAFISIGYLADIRVIASLPHEWGSFSAFLGAAVFPVGLMLIIIAGGELLTGNMMAVSMACLAKRITAAQLIKNWFWITISNFIGALFVAYFFGHIAELTASGPYLEKTVSTAAAKLESEPLAVLFSAIGCNWLVGMAVWMAYGADGIGGKILAIWFPIMAFVAIGFQHVVANMFIIPAAIFEGHFNWMDYFRNFILVFIGNAIGGTLFVSVFYWTAYRQELVPDSSFESKEE
ncbi:formate/nitrite transporter family protein [Pseudobacillus badius]|uniref:formate/nitrite transporter family protein n=1 Tax=Bacillus badius TaxID=1455 RepID=UPI0007B0AF0F|nr:formate/nitrite transporter family protein [Bacillus badius]KZO00348.1 formate/nitrite transporter [Bacillus badius]OCS86515.1 formate/nitrite transporter [Bacillus badius]OVE52021.1 formate/nitrite transporter [Bacillus badius]TDW03719.1 formate/nitrite transporter [Bacillus badius]